jgi:hypothetical protein
VETKQVLDVVEWLFNAAGHPDIVEVERYGRDLKPGGQSPAGVRITYGSGAQTYLFAAAPSEPAPQPHPLPEQMPPLKLRALHSLKFLIELLDVARPDGFTAWRTVSFAGVWMKPAALEIRCTDGTSAYLRVTCTSGPVGDPETPPFPDYVIPEAVKTCLREANAASAAPE